MGNEEFFNRVKEITDESYEIEYDYREIIEKKWDEYKNLVKGYDCDSNFVDDTIGKLKEIVEACYSGLPSKGYNKMKDLLESMRYDDILLKDESHNEFYRMRIFEQRRRGITREEMFHIPLDMRNKIEPQRYSTLGSPCLYMGCSVYGCWEEMERPRMSDCWVSKLKSTEVIKLLDLRFPHNKNEFEDKKEQYIKLFPLLMVCMIQVKDHKVAYKPEYCLTQLIMEWVKDESNDYYGIIYTSVMGDKDFDYPNEKLDNVAIPVKDSLSKEKFCPELVKKFKITDPINEEIEQVKEQRGQLWNETDMNNYDKSSFAYLEERLEKKEIKSLSC